jgi:hypothetical protein
MPVTGLAQLLVPAVDSDFVRASTAAPVCGYVLGSHPRLLLDLFRRFWHIGIIVLPDHVWQGWLGFLRRFNN